MSQSKYWPPPWRLACIACLGVAALLGSAPIASAGPTSVKIETNLTGLATDWVLRASGTTSALNAGFTTGSFTFSVASASGTDNPAHLMSSNLSIAHTGTGPDSILIAVTVQGYSKPNGAVSVVSQVSGSNASGALIDLQFQSVIDNLNRDDHFAFGGTSLGLQTGFSVSGSSFNNTKTGVITGVDGEYSILQLFRVSMAGDGTVVTLGGDTLLAQAPEPASMTLFGVGLAGMVGYGWRKRRQQQQATADVA